MSAAVAPPTPTRRATALAPRVRIRDIVTSSTIHGPRRNRLQRSSPTSTRMEAQQYGVRVKKMRRHLGVPAMSSTRCTNAHVADFRHFTEHYTSGFAILDLLTRPIPGRARDAART